MQARVAQWPSTREHLLGEMSDTPAKRPSGKTATFDGPIPTEPINEIHRFRESNTYDLEKVLTLYVRGIRNQGLWQPAKQVSLWVVIESHSLAPSKYQKLPVLIPAKIPGSTLVISTTHDRCRSHCRHDRPSFRCVMTIVGRSRSDDRRVTYLANILFP